MLKGCAPVIDPQQLNTYSYARNNPLTLIDPTGNAVADFQPYLPLKESVYLTGDQLGTYKGNKLYSGGELTGTLNSKHQCVDFVKRYSGGVFGGRWGSIGVAANFGISELANNSFTAIGTDYELSVHSNGGSVMPQEDDIITWTNGYAGHTGIIAEVYFSEQSGSGFVYTIEQNVKGSGLYTQPFTRTFGEGGKPRFLVTTEGRSDLSKYQVQGWTRGSNEGIPASQTPHTPAPKTSLPQPERNTVR